MPVNLTGQYCSLAPLSAEQCEDLKVAARDGDLWRLWYTSVPDPDTMAAEIERRHTLMAAGSMLPFAVVSPSGTAIGMTSFMNIDAVFHRVEIGSTWYARSVQRSLVNTECKQMLLTYAFENLECIAVEFRTHRFNRSSRAAIERLGAQLDGVLRNHQRAKDGTLRDTCVYSIIQSEWPTVKSHLRWLLDMPRN